MVQKDVMAALKGGGGEGGRTQVVATETNKSSDEDEALGINCINLADSE